MKTPEEIRRYCGDLAVSMAKPCDCQGEHAMPCFLGGKMMMAVLQSLSWVLGDNPGYEELIQGLRKRNKENP